MATFVIVHGGWGGGWEWATVARELRERGHQVLTPTLTGMGDRAHLETSAAVTLSTHVADVIAALEFEDLHDVVLCGASYGGMPVTGAADAVPERVALVIYIDAIVPDDGQSALDLLPAQFGEMVRAGLDEHGAAWRVPIPPGLLPSAQWAAPGDLTRYVARLRDQPAASFTEPLRLTGGIDTVPRAFVHCLDSDFDDVGADPVAPCAARARAAGWPYRKLHAPHDPQLADPAGTAAILHELSSVALLERAEPRFSPAAVEPVSRTPGRPD